MNYREAFNAAILGDAIRSVEMAEGTLVKYDFQGLRIYTAAGASSGFMPQARDLEAEWEIVPNEHYEAYKRVLAEASKAFADDVDVLVLEYAGTTTKEQVHALANWGNRQAFGRVLRPVPAAPPVVKEWALDPAKIVGAAPAPAARDPWGRPVNVGTPTPPAEPKRDSWGQLIPDE